MTAHEKLNAANNGVSLEVDPFPVKLQMMPWPQLTPCLQLVRLKQSPHVTCALTSNSQKLR